MNEQSKRDVIAAIAIGCMFLGAFILPITSVGFILIGGGALATLALFVVVALDRR